MINIEAVDTHIDPYTHTNEYSSEPQLLCAIPFTLRYVTKPEVRFVGIPVDQHMSTTPVTSLPVLFSFLVSAFRHPHDQITKCLAKR